MKEIKVIMASHLKPYPKSAQNRVFKFIRAVNSFIQQTYEYKELIIVSDGCEMTNSIYEKQYAQYQNITLIKLPKQPLLSGNVRQAGLDYLNDKDCIVCYLDSDDELEVHHLTNIISQFDDNLDFVYYDDKLKHNNGSLPIRIVTLDAGKVGTSSIAHKNDVRIKWNLPNNKGDGYGHDREMINNMITLNLKNKKINNCGYIVHHIPGIIDN